MGKIFILICVSGAWKHKNERMGGGPCSPSFSRNRDHPSGASALYIVKNKRALFRDLVQLSRSHYTKFVTLLSK